MFTILWRVSVVAISILGSIRFGGLHTVDYLSLKDVPGLMWLPPLVAIVLYATSFFVPRLNTSAAVAVIALSSAALLTWALSHICLWHFPAF